MYSEQVGLGAWTPGAEAGHLQEPPGSLREAGVGRGVQRRAGGGGMGKCGAGRGGAAGTSGDQPGRGLESYQGPQRVL